MKGSIMKHAAWPICLVVALAHAVPDAPIKAERSTQTTLYKSVGPDGKTIYSDRAPPDPASAKTLTFENPPASPLSASTLAYIEQLRKARPSAAASPPPAGETLLFTTAWCGFCKKARAHLARRGIAFREIDTETPDGAAAYVQAGGQKGVPLLVANGRRWYGYSPASYDQVGSDGPRAR